MGRVSAGVVFLCVAVGVLALSAGSGAVKTVARRRPQPPKAVVSCQEYPLYGEAQPLTSVVCQIHSNFTVPTCVQLKCPPATQIGSCPIGGTGQGTNTIRPGPCSGNVAPGCISPDPLWTNTGNQWTATFTIPGFPPQRFAIGRIFAPDAAGACGPKCDHCGN